MWKRNKEHNDPIVEEDKERANADSSAHMYGYAQHRRSKSASEKNFNPPTVGDSYFTRKDFHQSSDIVPCISSCRASPLHKNFSIKDDISNQRASLEQDIDQLQLRLRQEKSMRGVLERAMGRASSTLSPGHRHFAAQTKELIAEIELLEEEVAEREQHVLSLYRSIFEHVSRPASEHTSVVTSPAHAKSESRKHPRIISSAFCSSKNFPLRNIHSLATINDSGKRSLLQSKTRHVSLLNAKESMHFEKSFSIKVPTTSKNYAPRTLKDHLYQCPSKLGEEMVRCMAAVYCCLRSTSTSEEQKQSHPSSKSSSGSILPRWSGGEGKDWSTKSTVEIPWISKDKSRFCRASFAISNYRFLVEQLEKVNVRKMDTNAQIAFWINLYNSLVMHVNLTQMLLVCHLRSPKFILLTFLYSVHEGVFGFWDTSQLAQKAAYNVGGHVISANTIEQSIFCYRAPRIGQWLETVLSTALRKKSGEERKIIRSKYRIQDLQPLVCFALCTGASSDPMLNVYTAPNIKEELDAAKREFLQGNIVVKKSKKILLPKLIEKYAKEVCVPVDEILPWITENVDKKLSDSIQKCCDSRPNKRASQMIKWSPYNSRFRYVFSKELTEKPWWA